MAGMNFIQGFYISPPLENMDYDFVAEDLNLKRLTTSRAGPIRARQWHPDRGNPLDKECYRVLGLKWTVPHFA